MGRSPCSKSKQGQTRGAYWTALEDKVLKDYIDINGAGMWDKLPEQTGLKRSGKSCRLRWMNYLRPDIIRGNITLDEEDLIIKLHKLLGNRWSLIARRLPGRTDNEIKNYWKTVLSKRVLQADCGHPRESNNSEDLFNEPSNSIDNHSLDPPPSPMQENVGGKRLIQQSFNKEVLEKNNKESDRGFSTDDSSWDLMMDLNERQIISQSILPNDDLDKLYARDGYIGYRNWSSPSSIESLSLINWIRVDSFQIESDLDLW